MQTRKFLFVIGLAATLAALALTSTAKDTPEQLKAREALRQKMAELDAAATPPTPSPVVAPAQPVAPVAAPAKKAPVAPAPVPPPPPAPTPATAVPGSPIFGPVPEPVEDAKTAQLREALRREMAALQSFGPVPEPVEDAKTAQLREALRREMAALQTSPTVPKKPIKSGRAQVFSTRPELTPPPMEVPLSPLTGSKAARMAELLQRYNADQISPKDYHTQRAAILAEP